MSFSNARLRLTHEFLEDEGSDSTLGQGSGQRLRERVECQYPLHKKMSMFRKFGGSDLYLIHRSGFGKKYLLRNNQLSAEIMTLRIV